MTISVSVGHRLGAFTLDVNFESAGRLTALFGQSGSGKTSIVDVIAGLARPDSGRVEVDGEVLLDTRRGIFVPPHRRRIGYVFQEARLFPHLTVRQNLLYGRWFAARREGYGHPGQVVEMLGIAHLLDRRPGRLSGGEKQRVAIGRALLARPRLLLMDEPLASLDEQRRAEILPYLERLRDEAGVPIVYVSHAVGEVMRLASHVVVLSEGRVAAAGEAGEIMQREDLFPSAGRAEAGAVLQARVARHDEAFGLSVLASAAGEITVPRLDAGLGTTVRLRIRARDVMLATRQPDGLSALNVLPGVVTAIGATAGPVVEIQVDCRGEVLVARLTRRSAERLELAPGRQVFAVIKTVAFDRRSLEQDPDGMLRGADADSLRG